MKNGPIENVGIVNKSYDQDEDGEETRLINYLDDNVPGELVDEEKLIAASTGTGYVVKRNTSLESVAVSLQELNTETPQPDAFNVESDKEKILDKELHSHNDDVEKGILKEPKQSDHDKPHSSTNDLVKTKSSKGCSLCATIIIALLCILLGIAIGYLIFSVVGDNAPITPAPESTTATSASSSTMTPSTTLPSTLSTSPTNPTPDGSTSDGQVTTAPPSTTPGAVTSDSTGEFTTGVLVSSSDSSLTSETTISSTTIAQSTISSGTFTSDSTDGLTTEQSTTETSSMIISSEPTEETTITPSTTSSIAVTSDSTESQTTSFTTEDASAPASTESSIAITTQETTKESITSAGETTFETTTFVPEATTEILCGCECSRNYWLPGCNDRNGTICDKVGERMPESNDCADFAECSDSGSGNVEYETKQCPPGTVYNAATWTCIDEDLLYCSSSANETSSGVCASSPCLNGGTCIEYTDGTYGCVCQIDCSCQLGKVGDNCENAFDTDDTAGRVRICAGVDSGAVFPYAPKCDGYWFCPLFVGDPALLRFCHVIQPNDCPNEGDCYFVSELGQCVPKSPLPNDCLPPPFLPGQPPQSTESSEISSTASRTSMFFTTESPTIEVTSDLQMTTANDLSTELNCGCQCSRDSWTSGCEPRDGQQCEVEGTRVQESELCGEFAQCVDVGGTQTYQYETRACPAGQVYDQVSWRCIDEDLPFCNSQNNGTAVPSACASNPCQNNGTCVDYTDGTYGCVCRIACSCLLGKVGDNCENAFDEDDVASRIRICDQQAAGTTFPYALRGDAFWYCPFVSGDPALLITCAEFEGRECPSDGDCYYVPDLRICQSKSPLPDNCQPPTN